MILFFRMTCNPLVWRISARHVYPRQTRRLRTQDVTFLNVGYEEDLTFPDSSFEVVINIESSHCYPDIPGFLGGTPGAGTRRPLPTRRFA